MRTPCCSNKCQIISLVANPFPSFHQNIYYADWSKRRCFASNGMCVQEAHPIHLRSSLLLYCHLPSVVCFCFLQFCCWCKSRSTQQTNTKSKFTKIIREIFVFGSGDVVVVVFFGMHVRRGRNHHRRNNETTANNITNMHNCIVMPRQNLHHLPPFACSSNVRN